MFSLSIPSQTAFPVLFPTFLHSSLPSFHHWGPTVLFDVFLLAIHICLGQWLSDCDAGSLGVKEEEVATIYLYRALWDVARKSTVIVIKFRFASAWPALPCENSKGLQIQKALLQVVLWRRRNISLCCTAPASRACRRRAPLGQIHTLPNQYCVRLSPEVAAVCLFRLEVIKMVGLLMY